jgi:hypothetical protein
MTATPETAFGAPVMEGQCPLGEMHGMASTFGNENGERCCDFCGRPIEKAEGSPLPPYDGLVADVFKSYLIELVGREDEVRWARLPATWLWYEFWDRLAQGIAARSDETQSGSAVRQEPDPQDAPNPLPESPSHG